MAEVASPDQHASRQVAVVGGDGVWGSEVVEVLREHLTEVRVAVVPDHVDALAQWLEQGRRPDGVVLACEDPDAGLLSLCLRRGLAVVDLAWSLADVDVAQDLMGAHPDPSGVLAPVLAPVGWAGSVAAIALASAVAPLAGGERAAHVDVDVLLAAGDRADDWWWRRFADLHRTFAVWDRGGRRLARGLGEPKAVRFSDGRRRIARRIDSPEQDTTVEAQLTGSLAVRVAFEHRSTGLLLALSVGSGAWRFLPASWRRAVLEPRRTSSPAPHEIVVTAAYPSVVVRASIVDDRGRSHLVAAGALTQVARLVQGRSAGAGIDPRRVLHPEGFPDVARDLALLREAGVVVEAEVVARVSPEPA